MRRAFSTLSRRFLPLAAVGLVAAMLVPPGAAAPDPLKVSVTGGAVHGVTDGVTSEWRGIPYAASPVGPRRWRPPAAVVPWAGTRDATKFAPPCAQPGQDVPVDGTEDCLHLNVFAPAGTRPNARLPVMVHLHGGSNWVFHAYQNAGAFVRRGVIVVTVSYRLGVFGFMGHPALSAEGGGSSGEYGVLDQLAALRWVQNNIGAFGGNAANVTLFGESAGSFDAVGLAASPLGQGLFIRLAAQTEAVFAARGVNTIQDAESLGLDVADKVGCTQAADVAACLRTQSTASLVTAGGFNDVTPYVGGRLLSASPLSLIAAQRNPVPMLLGSNREEASFWLWDWVVGGQPYGADAWYRDTNALTGASNGDTVRALYPRSEYGSYLWSTVAAFTDAVYTCPMRQLALASKGPVYRYLYTHVLADDPTATALRAGHFLDDPILWNDPSLLGGYQFNPADEALSARMTSYWANFAKTGDPNGPGLPTWPRYSSGAEHITVLDDPAGQLVGYHLPQCAHLDSQPPPFEPTRSYVPGALQRN